MARRPPDPPKDVQPTPQQIRAAISRFERRVKEVEAFEPEKVTDRRDPQIDALEAAIGEALTEAFGEETPMRQRYSVAASLDTAGTNMNGTPHHEVIDGLKYGKTRALTLMNQAIRSLEERLADYVPVEQVELMNGPPSKDVFVVHGHDDEFKREVADVLRRAGLNPVILHEQPNGGKTIIEKFEKHGGGAGFAVVLLTPDDVGGPSADQLRPRARQNVVGEKFWFAGKLGRSKVCALKKGDIEVPSDFAGVVYTSVDERDAWKKDLLKELHAAGYTDLNWVLALS